MGNLCSDTQVEDLASGRFVATLSPDWQLVGPNGGYLAAVALRAAQRLAGGSEPASISCQFLTAARFGRVELTACLLRATERATALRVSMVQGAAHLLEALVWARPDRSDGPTVSWGSMPAVPGPQRLQDLRPQLLEGNGWVPRWHERQPAGGTDRERAPVHLGPVPARAGLRGALAGRLPGADPG
jgi:acyl-CoA thioesterase